MSVKELNNGYTVNEIKLFSYFGYDDLADHIEAGITLYQFCVNRSFINNITGSHVEILRKTYTAISECKMYRCTEEFESLFVWS